MGPVRILWLLDSVLVSRPDGSRILSLSLAAMDLALFDSRHAHRHNAGSDATWAKRRLEPLKLTLDSGAVLLNARHTAANGSC
jgi:hypothetical protein